MAARILDVTELEYHADPCARPSLSKSIAHLLVSRSPLHAWSAHPRLGGVRKVPTEVMNDGSVLHKLILGKGAEIEVIHVDAFRSDRAKALRDAAIAANKVPIKIADFEEISLAAVKMTDSFRALGYEFTGESEVAIEWTETTGSGSAAAQVLCRCRIDHVFLNDGVIYDLKKVRSAHEWDATRAMDEYGHDIQYVAYRRAVAALRPQHKAPRFVFLLAEFEEPYAVNHVEPDALWEEIGNMKWGQAISTWHQCLSRGSWPGYAGAEPTIVTPPTWVSHRWLGNDFDVARFELES
jgi:hypothetical protein